MRIERFNIDGVFSLIPPKRGDQRGFFSETYNKDAMAAAGVTANFVQDNHVYSASRGVLRGLHFQIPPRAQGKLIRCTRGAIWDVCVDIRGGSPTYGKHLCVELSAANWKQLWVPPGFAHGYVTLEADCEVIYKVTDVWAPDCERGVAWDDPDLGIDWRLPPVDFVMADKDRANPRLAQIEEAFRYEDRNL
jgi:dTDP-4-dehydrorhamnose 3,5-epimerase